MAAGWAYRLPTESEREYAVRGGSKSKGYTYAGSNNAGDVAWYYDSSGQQTHAVGQLQPNELGLHDMSGNVWEWCEDVYEDTYEGAPTDGSARLGSGPVRVFRGGGWFASAGLVRSADRFRGAPSSSYRYLGFRVCLARSSR